MSTDPVHYDTLDHKWYFWDETWADRVGPYDTEEDARIALKEYCKKLDEWREVGKYTCPIHGLQDTEDCPRC